MDFSAFFIFFVALFCSKFFLGKLTAPLGIFALSWTLVLLTHYLNVLPFYPLSQATIHCVFVLALGFLIGSMTAAFTSKSGRQSNVMSLTASYRIYTNWAQALLCIGLILGLGIYVIFNGIVIATLGVHADAGDRFGDALPGMLRNAMYLWGFPSLLTATLIAASLHARLQSVLEDKSLPARESLVALQKRLMYVLIVGIAAEVTADLVSASRVHIIQTGFVLIASYVFITPIRLTLKTIGRLAAIAALLLWLVGTITVSRNAELGGTVFTGWLVYYTGALSYFDQWMLTSRFDSYHWGHESLGKIFEWFAWPLWSQSRMKDIMWAQSVTPMQRQEFLYIGSGLRYNAFGTFMMDGYLDLGTLGVGIMAALLGYLSTYLYKKSVKSHSPLVVCLSVLTMCWVLWTPIGWADATISNWVTIPAFFFIIEIFVKKQNKKTMNNTQSVPGSRFSSAFSRSSRRFR